MVKYRVSALIYALSVIVSIFFIAYSGSLFFDAYTFPRKISIKVESFHVMSQGEDAVAETVLLIQNEYKLDAKVFYVKQEIYQYPNYKGLLGERYVSGRPPSLKYVLFLHPFDSGTLTMSILIKDYPFEESSVNLYSVVYMGIEDIPLINYFILKNYFILTT